MSIPFSAYIKSIDIFLATGAVIALVALAFASEAFAGGGSGGGGNGGGDGLENFWKGMAQRKKLSKRRRVRRIYGPKMKVRRKKIRRVRRTPVRPPVAATAPLWPQMGSGGHSSVMPLRLYLTKPPTPLTVPTMGPATPIWGPASSITSIVDTANTTAGTITDGVPGALPILKNLKKITGKKFNPGTIKKYPNLKRLVKSARTTKTLARNLTRGGNVLTVLNLALSAVDISAAKNAKEYSQAVDNYVRTSVKAAGSIKGGDLGVAAGLALAASSAVPTGGLGAVAGMASIPVLGLIGAAAGNYAAGRAYNAHASAAVMQLARYFYANQVLVYHP